MSKDQDTADKAARQGRIESKSTDQGRSSRGTGAVMPFKLLHRPSNSVNSHTSGKSRDRYSSQKKCRHSTYLQPLQEAEGDKENAQIVKNLAGHYKEYCDEDEKSRSKSTRGSNARSAARLRRAGAEEKEETRQGSEDEAAKPLDGEKFGTGAGIRALEALVGDYRGEEGDERQNSFQKRIGQCEAYFTSHINCHQEEAAAKLEEDGDSAEELMPGMTSKKQEQFLMKDSLSPSYGPRTRQADKEIEVAEDDQPGGSAGVDGTQEEANQERQKASKEPKQHPGARHQRLRTQIQIIEEEGRNRESLINQKDLGQLAPPNSEIKQKMSRLMAAAKKGGTSDDQHQQLSQHQSNNSSSVARFGFKSGGPSQPAGASITKGQQHLYQFDTSQRSTMMHQVTAAPASGPTGTSINEPSMNTNPVIDKSLKIPFQPMPSSDDYVNFIDDRERGSTAERLNPDAKKKQQHQTKNTDENSENDFDLSHEVPEGDTNIQKMINEFSDEQDYKAQNGALRLQLAEMSTLNLSLRRKLAQVEQLLRNRSQQSHDLHLSLRNEKQRNEKYSLKLRNQQGLLRKLSSSLVSMGFSDLLNTILKEHRLEQPALPTPRTYSSKHRGAKVAQQARNKGGKQLPHQNTSILKINNEYSSYLLNKSSASGVSLPPFTQFSQTIRDDGVLTEELLDLEEDGLDKYYSKRNRRQGQSGDRCGLPHSTASNNAGLGLDNRSMISEDCYYTRQSRTSCSCNSRHLVDRSRSSMNSRSRSRKLSRQYKSFHNAANRIQKDRCPNQLEVGSTQRQEGRLDRAKKMRSLYSTLNNSRLPTNELIVKKYRRSAIQSNEDGVSSQGGLPYHLDHQFGLGTSELEVHGRRTQSKASRKPVAHRRQSGGRSFAGKASLHHPGQQYTKGIKQSRTMGPSTPQQTLLTPTNSQFVNEQRQVAARGDGRGRPLADDKIDNQTELQRRTSHALVAGQPSSLSSAAEKYGLHQLESTSNMADVIKAHNKLNRQGARNCHDNGFYRCQRRIHDLTPSSGNGDLNYEQRRAKNDQLGQPLNLESNGHPDLKEKTQYDSMHNEERLRIIQELAGQHAAAKERHEHSQGETAMNEIENDSIQNDEDEEKERELHLFTNQHETVDKSFQQFQTFDTKPQESAGNPAIAKAAASRDAQFEMLRTNRACPRAPLNLKLYQRKSLSQSGQGNQQQIRPGRLSAQEVRPKLYKQMTMAPQNPQRVRAPILDLSSIVKITNETQNSLDSAREAASPAREPLLSHRANSIPAVAHVVEKFKGKGDQACSDRQETALHASSLDRDLCVRQNILRSIVNNEAFAPVDLHGKSGENFPYFTTQQCTDAQQEVVLVDRGGSLPIDATGQRRLNDGTRRSGREDIGAAGTPGRAAAEQEAEADSGAHLGVASENPIFQTYQDETLTTQMQANLEKPKIFGSTSTTRSHLQNGRPSAGPARASQMSMLSLQQQQQHQMSHQNQYMDTLPPEMQMKFITTEANEFLDTQYSHRSSTNQRGSGGELHNNYLSQKFMLEEVREEERDESYPHTQRTHVEKANNLQSQRNGLNVQLQQQPNFLFQVNLENDQKDANQWNEGEAASLDFYDILKLQGQDSTSQQVMQRTGTQQPDNVPLCNQKPPIVLSNAQSRVRRPPLSQGCCLRPKVKRAQGGPSCGPNTEFSTFQQDSELQRQRLLQERQSSQKKIIERLVDPRGEQDVSQEHAAGRSLQGHQRPAQEQANAYKIEMKILGQDGRLERRKLNNNNSRLWYQGIEAVSSLPETQAEDVQAQRAPLNGPQGFHPELACLASGINMRRKHNTANSHSSSNMKAA